MFRVFGIRSLATLQRYKRGMWFAGRILSIAALKHSGKYVYLRV